MECASGRRASFVRRVCRRRNYRVDSASDYSMPARISGRRCGNEGIAHYYGDRNSGEETWCEKAQLGGSCCSVLRLDPKVPHRLSRSRCQHKQTYWRP